MAKYLEFDHLQFKLIIIQKLMYELHLFEDEYHLGEKYVNLLNNKTIKNGDVSLKAHIEAAISYFEKLQIPIEMADKIYNLFIHEGNEIYFEINPFWRIKDEYKNGKEFSIASISKKELKHFPKLRQISFHNFNDGGQRLVHFLEKQGIEVIDYQQQYADNQSLTEKIKYHNYKTITTKEKKINPMISLLVFCFICSWVLIF